VARENLTAQYAFFRARSIADAAGEESVAPGS
jgi:hypothetical protein